MIALALPSHDQIVKLRVPMEYVPPGAPVVNALFKQRACIENLFRACVGLSPDNHMLLEHKRGMAELSAAGSSVKANGVKKQKK